MATNDPPYSRMMMMLDEENGWKRGIIADGWVLLGCNSLNRFMHTTWTQTMSVRDQAPIRLDRENDDKAIGSKRTVGSRLTEPSARTEPCLSCRRAARRCNHRRRETS